MRFVTLNILASLLTITPAYAQTCRTEAEIPSSTPSSDFTDNGDGTVTHHKTGLMWMKCPLGQSGSDCATGSANSYTWQQALEAADGHGFAGYTDWRLPNIKELASIVERACYAPAINLSMFPNEVGSDVWSSSPSANRSDYAWELYFFSGGGRWGIKNEHGHHVRLVRGG